MEAWSRVGEIENQFTPAEAAVGFQSTCNATIIWREIVVFFHCTFAMSDAVDGPCYR